LDYVALRAGFFISALGTRVNFALLKVAGFWHVMACCVVDVPTFRGKNCCFQHRNSFVASAWSWGLSFSLNLMENYMKICEADNKIIQYFIPNALKRKLLERDNYISENNIKIDLGLDLRGSCPRCLISY